MACADAFAAEIVRVLPLASVTTALVKTGLPSTSVSVPGVSGYMPSSLQTYQELIAPRSSLPNWPTGASKYSFCCAARTVCCVLYGAPVKSYSQGLSTLGSLDRSALAG